MQSMISKRAILLFVVAIAVVPAVATAKEIKVDTGNVRVITNNNGAISVQTNKSNLSLPRRRFWYPWRYWRSPNSYYPNSNSCRYTHQQNSHTTSRAGNQIYQSTTISSCR